MNNPTRLVGLLVMAASLGACAADPTPTAEIRQFGKAFEAVNSIGAPLLDDMAVAERRIGRDQAVARARGRAGAALATGDSCPGTPWFPLGPDAGYIDGFCNAEAAYYTDAVDPPATQAFRAALRIVERYAEVLLLLAEDSNLPAARNEIDAIGGNITGLLALVPGASNVGAAIDPALTALQPIFERAARQSNAAETRRLILEGGPATASLIKRLADAAPEMFKTLIATQRTRLISPEVLNTPALRAPEIAKIEAYRTAVASYVVLLDELGKALDLTIAAARTPERQRSSMRLAEKTTEIRVQAEAVRRALSALRTL